MAFPGHIWSEELLVDNLLIYFLTDKGTVSIAKARLDLNRSIICELLLLVSFIEEIGEQIMFIVISSNAPLRIFLRNDLFYYKTLFLD